MAFGRRKQDPTAAPQEDSVQLADPNREPDDNRQLLHQLLTHTGLSWILYSPWAATDLLRASAQIAPTLQRSTVKGKCFLSLDVDPATLWTVVQGTRGSAIVVFGSPESDIDTIFPRIAQPFESVRPPLSHGFVFSGSAPRTFAALLTDAELVPAWEVDEFRHISDQSGYTDLPGSIRWAARGWEPGPGKSLRRDFVDLDGDNVSVILLCDEYPKLVERVGESSDGDVSGLACLATAGGPYSLEWWNPAVMFTRPVPTGIGSPELLELAQTLCNDLAAGLATIRDRPAPAPHFSSRSFPIPVTGVAYTVTERVRESVPSGTSTFESVNERALRLRSARGSGFEHTLRGPGDELLSPPWITVNSAAVDQDSGRYVAAGRLTHQVWDMPPAHDLGAIDGRNGATFTEQGHPGGLMWPTVHLYAGSMTDATTIPLGADGNVISVDLHGRTGTIAALEFLGGSVAAVALHRDGQPRQLLTVVDGISGAEPIQFSGNGQWLLVQGGLRTTLVEVSTGRWLQLDVGSATWWPTAPSTLLSVANVNDQPVPRLVDLSTNEFTGEFPALRPDFVTLPELGFWGPAVSPDGHTLLAITASGVPQAYRDEHGAGGHLVEVDLASGRAVLAKDPFVDDRHELERDTVSARWTGRLPDVPVHLHESLAAALQDPVRSHEYLAPGRWSDDIEQPLVLTLNKVIDLMKAGDDASLLMPEVVAYTAVLGLSSEAWGRQAEWLTSLRDTTANMVSSGELSGSAADAWTEFGHAVATAQERSLARRAGRSS